jgi:hypothetical protein
MAGVVGVNITLLFFSGCALINFPSTNGVGGLNLCHFRQKHSALAELFSIVQISTALELHETSQPSGGKCLGYGMVLLLLFYGSYLLQRKKIAQCPSFIRSYVTL